MDDSTAALTSIRKTEGIEQMEGREATCDLCGYTAINVVTLRGTLGHISICYECWKTPRHFTSWDGSGHTYFEKLTNDVVEEKERSETEVRKVRIPRSLSKKVFERDAYRCVYCGSYTSLQCDHVIPESRGGETTLKNLVTACGSCNARKKDRTPEEAGMKRL